MSTITPIPNSIRRTVLLWIQDWISDWFGLFDIAVGIVTPTTNYQRRPTINMSGGR